MMPNVDPKQMQAVQKVTSHISAILKVNPRINEIQLTLVPEEGNTEAEKAAEQIVTMLSQLLGQQLRSFFGITGKLQIVKK